ncbi:GMC oxidoreductase-domain-containing protein [Mycena albidolilacea]|uniref:GMC oxidoreductase-domain-containing protein n=1 Tax=Mycena albidolilacea TaxID=1033008 RepID=A0AAD7EWV0_9AGAR|nr:GMC oxidoreductase-domain-containing protein [Mycena albidolilacea]
MKAIEHNIPPSEAQRADGANLVPSFHGFNGPVNVSFPAPMRIPEAHAIYKAAIALVFGIPDSPDLSARNGSVSVSTSWTIWWDPVAQFTRRASAAYSLLYPQPKQQKTLTALAELKVAKVIFDKNMKATGLQFAPANGGAFSIVNAKYEVLLTAGSLAILEHSGVGNKSVLSKVGIKQLVDLPGVGLNLQDQPGTALSASVQTANVSDTLLIDNVNQAFLAQFVWAWPLTPLSRGHIHIHTSDTDSSATPAFASPRITPRFLSDDFDVETGVEIAQKARDLYTTFPFQPIISEVVIDAVPANATDNDWAKWYHDTSFAFCGGFLAAADPITLEVAVAAHGLVISLVAYTHHTAVMQAAIEGKTHIITTSSSMVKEFHLQCGALPTPDCTDSPLGYKPSWYPHGGLLALLNSASFLANDAVKHVAGADLMASMQPRIFPYLIPLRILYGHHPSDEFMHRFPILTDIFAPFIAMIRTGDIAGFDRARGLHVFARQTESWESHKNICVTSTTSKDKATLSVQTKYDDRDHVLNNVLELAKPNIGLFGGR